MCTTAREMESLKNGVCGVVGQHMMFTADWFIHCENWCFVAVVHACMNGCVWLVSWEIQLPLRESFPHSPLQKVSFKRVDQSLGFGPVGPHFFQFKYPQTSKSILQWSKATFFNLFGLKTTTSGHGRWPTIIYEPAIINELTGYWKDVRHLVNCNTKRQSGCMKIPKKQFHWLKKTSGVPMVHVNHVAVCAKGS